MLKLPDTLSAWNKAVNKATFNQTLKNEINSLPAGSLPLDKGTVEGGYVDDSNISVTVLQTDCDDSEILVKVGIFFTEVVICCGCGDDPMEKNAYCQMQVKIDRQTAEVKFSVTQD